MPYGQIQVDTVKDSLNNTFAPASSRFTNRLINGAMVIDQRNAGASVTPTGGTYLVDRWQLYATQSSKLTCGQNLNAITPPIGFTNYLGFSSTSAYSVLSTDYFSITQRIEGFNVSDLGYGTANAKTITVSFWVYSSLTGTFGGALHNNAFNRSYVFSYSISTANTWTQISVTIAGDTTGTWTTNNTVGLEIGWSLGAGSSQVGSAGAWSGNNYFGATSQTQIVGTNGATFYITGVQLEVGSNATSFEYRPYGTELTLCQRYYYKTYSQGTNPASATASGTRGGSAYNGGTGIAGNFSYAVSMRTAPTITPYGESGTSGVWSQAGGSNTGSASASLIGDQGFMQINISSLTAGNVYYGHYVATAEL